MCQTWRADASILQRDLGQQEHIRGEETICSWKMRLGVKQFKAFHKARCFVVPRHTVLEGSKPVRSKPGLVMKAMSDGRPLEPKFTNLLIHQQSPYLLQHAHNPVSWDVVKNLYRGRRVPDCSFDALFRSNGCHGVKKLSPRPKRSRNQSFCQWVILLATGRWTRWGYV